MGLLSPEGELIIGNFASPNSSQAFMELVSDWTLTLRTPQQLRHLASQVEADDQIEAGDTRIDVESEPTGVNLFLRMSR
jgi:hypothetical protein